MYNLLKSIAFFQLNHRNLFPANRILFLATRIKKKSSLRIWPFIFTTKFAP